MLARMLEAESMDTPEEAAEYDEMDHSEVNERFVADFLRVHGPCRGGEIVDLGTGTARIPIALCRADPGSKVLGIDLSEAMLAVGQENVEAFGLSSRVRLAVADAKLSNLASGQYEGVISNSIVHHIPKPGPALGEMARLVAPGGTLFVRDLYRPDDSETLARIVQTYAGRESPRARGLFEDSLHAALTLDEVRALVKAIGLPPEGANMTSDRHWSWTWKRPA